MRNTGNYLPLVNLVAGGFTFWCRQQLAQRPRSVPDLASSSAAVKNQAAPPLPRVGATQRNLRLLVHYGVGAALGFLRMDPCSFDPCSCNWIALARNCILQDLSSSKKESTMRRYIGMRYTIRNVCCEYFSFRTTHSIEPVVSKSISEAEAENEPRKATN